VAPAADENEYVDTSSESAVLGAAPSVTVLVPLRDEQPTLTPLYESVRDVLEANGRTFELLFVDDGSTDGSVDTLRALMAVDDRVRGLRLRRNFGKAAALATGFREADGDAIVTIDADLQDDPAEIPRLLDELERGFGVVSGWKRDRKDPLSRRLASKVFNWATRILAGVSLHDVNCGLKAYTRECAREVADSCYGDLHRYLPVVARWKGFPVTEIRVNHHPRANGRSRYGFERYLRGFLDLLTTTFLARYARRPMHVFGGVGVVLFTVGAGSLTLLLVEKLALGAKIGDRPLLILGSILLLAGLQLILTGLLAEMISRLPAVMARSRGGGAPAFPVVALSASADGNGAELRRTEEFPVHALVSGEALSARGPAAEGLAD
jgi:glycosyltransferase involved in cell wall biosynthesis